MPDQFPLESCPEVAPVKKYRVKCRNGVEVEVMRSYTDYLCGSDGINRLPNGRRCVDREDPLDLMPPKRVLFEEWVNLSGDGLTDAWPTLERAARDRAADCVCTYHSTIYADDTPPEIEVVWRKGEE